MTPSSAVTFTYGVNIENEKTYLCSWVEEDLQTINPRWLVGPCFLRTNLWPIQLFVAFVQICLKTDGAVKQGFRLCNKRDTGMWDPWSQNWPKHSRSIRTVTSIWFPESENHLLHFLTPLFSSPFGSVFGRPRFQLKINEPRKIKFRTKPHGQIFIAHACFCHAKTPCPRNRKSILYEKWLSFKAF